MDTRVSLMETKRFCVVLGCRVELPVDLQRHGKIEFKFVIVGLHRDRGLQEGHTFLRMAAGNQRASKKASRDRAVLTAIDRVAEKCQAILPVSNLHETDRGHPGKTGDPDCGQEATANEAGRDEDPQPTRQTR